MIVWTIQPRLALDQINLGRAYRCDEKKTFNLTKPDSLKPAYQWLMGRMEEKIGAPPFGVTYPIWAWHTWDFERRCPDPDSAAFLMRDTEKVRGRRSVRTFDGQGLRSEDLEKLSSYMVRLENPYEIPVECKLLDAKQHSLKCPVVSGTDLYVGAKAKRVPHIEEAFGYSFELLVLYAQSLGIGTVWVGGTMDRAVFERAMELKEGEMMPCMSPLGYPARKMSIKESMMRKGIRADSRNPFETMFFDGDFGIALTPEKADKLANPLEMVRWAPSAVNKQPWQVVVNKNAAHFYLKHTKGFVSDAVGDMQKIDMGIALCHFALAAEENGLNVQFCISDPKITAESDTEYIASYLIQ